MSMALPLHFLVVIFAGWVSRQQQAVIEYLQAENEVLKSQLKGRRITLTDDERRKLAIKGKALGRKLLSGVACIVTRIRFWRAIGDWLLRSGPFVVELGAPSVRG